MVAKAEHHLNSNCPVACALDVIGDHWTLLVVRNLMFLGLHEYKDMLACDEGISSNILTDRLEKLTENGLIASAPHPESKRRKLYYLTEKGKDLVFVMLDIARWSAKHLDDRVFIPKAKKRLLALPSKKASALALKELKGWEKEWGITQKR